MLVLLLISRVVLEYINTISKPTKIAVGWQSILIVCVKMVTIFFSFCLFKLLNKFVLMPQTLNKFYGTEKNMSKASYLPQLMAWTIWLTSTVPNVRVIGNKFLQLIIFNYYFYFNYFLQLIIVTINHHCLGFVFNLFFI